MEGNEVLLTLYNEVLDVNGARALGDGNEFEIIIANGDYSTRAVLRNGQFTEIRLPRGAFSIIVNPDSLTQQAGSLYEYMALIGPDGLVDNLTLDLTNVAAANATVITRIVGAPTIGGGALEVAMYVIENGRLLQAEQGNMFQIGVQGTRLIAVEPLSELSGGEAAALAEDADGQAAEAASEEEAAEAAETSEAADGAEAPEAAEEADEAAGEPAAEAAVEATALLETLEYATMEDTEAEGTTQNAIETEPDADGSGAGAPADQGDQPEPAEQGEPSEPEEPAGAEQPEQADEGAADAEAGEPDEEGAIAVPLADVEEPYQSDGYIAQGTSYRFDTGRGNFTVTETLALNSGYELIGIYPYNESARLLDSSANRSLDVYVADDVGTVVLVLNKGVAIVVDPTPAPPASGAGIPAEMSISDSIAPGGAVDIGDDDLAYGAFLADHIQYIYGYEDGTVRADKTITRAETAAVIFRLLADRAKDRDYPMPFSDVEQGKWYTQPIAYLAAQGIIVGYPDGTFKPDQPITRAEFAKMIAGFDSLSEVSYNVFTDVDDHWATGFINSAAAKGWVSGYPDNTFKPEESSTRAEIVTIINRMLNRQIEAEDVPAWAPSYTDLDASHWAYTAIIEASVTHTYQFKDNGFEIWDEPGVV
jgi:hypothetical protein